MNLHLCYDEKVYSRTISSFEEALPKQNKFVVVQQRDDEPRQFVKNDLDSIFFAKYDTNEFWNIIGDIKKYNNIIYHFFSYEMVDFTMRIPVDSPITWIVWGADLYNALLIKRGYELYAYPQDIKPVRFIERIKEKLSYFNDKKNFNKRLEAVRRVKCICALDCDYDLLLRYYPEFKNIIRKNFFYYPIDEIVGDSLINISGSGNSIIVGNSGSYTNNHRYVFEKLRDIDLEGRDVIVPLSYGKGITQALEAGKLIKGNFKPIMGFMPIAEYNKVLASASTFIYGNFRQEAVGNILIAFYLGATVFLDEKNPLLKEYKNEGFILFSLSQLKEKIHYKLKPQERGCNRELVIKLYNRELMLQYIRESFENE